MRGVRKLVRGVPPSCGVRARDVRSRGVGLDDVGVSVFLSSKPFTRFCTCGMHYN